MASKLNFVVVLLVLLTIAGVIGLAYFIIYTFYEYPFEIHIVGYPGKQIPSEHRFNTTVDDTDTAFYFDHKYIDSNTTQDTLKANITQKIGYKTVKTVLYNTTGGGSVEMFGVSDDVFIARNKYVYIELYLKEDWVMAYLTQTGLTRNQFLNNKEQVLPLEAFGFSMAVESMKRNYS